MSQEISKPILDEITVMFSCETCGKAFSFVDKLQAHEADHTKTRHEEAQDEGTCALMTWPDPIADPESSDWAYDHSSQNVQEPPIALARHPQGSVNNIGERNRCSSPKAQSCISKPLRTLLTMSVPRIADTVDCSVRQTQLDATATDTLFKTHSETSTSNFRKDQTPEIMQVIRLPPILPDGNFQRTSLPSLQKLFGYGMFELQLQRPSLFCTSKTSFVGGTL
ncbi:hypothetical protein F5883DRAFT_667926 [Diaporthe sp. PMI_573]|nr:hypothetical protein F5883DRAFT_667926 [Diaporthaceae sp. PMI_573]